MKLVIEIDEKDFDLMQFENAFSWDSVKKRIRNAIRNGTPLPKGHGRLIDGDYLYQRFVSNKCPDSMVLQFVKEEPTIIEADKAGEER